MRKLLRRRALPSALVKARPSSFWLGKQSKCHRRIALLKPSPHLIQVAINELDASPVECLLVGDSATDIQAAQLAAVDVIGYANRPGEHDTFATAVVTSSVLHSRLP